MNCDPANLAALATCYCFPDQYFDAVAIVTECVAAGGEPMTPPREQIVLGNPDTQIIFGNPAAGTEFGTP